MLSPTAKPFAKPIHLEVSSSNPVYKFRVTRGPLYKVEVDGGFFPSAGAAKLDVEVVPPPVVSNWPKSPWPVRC